MANRVVVGRVIRVYGRFSTWWIILTTAAEIDIEKCSNFVISQNIHATQRLMYWL